MRTRHLVWVAAAIVGLAACKSASHTTHTTGTTGTTSGGHTGSGGSPPATTTVGSGGKGGSGGGATVGAGGSGGAGGGDVGGAGGGGGAGGSVGTGPWRVVAYLPNYSGSYRDWATKIDFTKMTHLILAFAKANGGNGWDMGAPNDEVRVLVDAAHAAGTKVLISLGGGGDESVVNRYKGAVNLFQLVPNLASFVTSHDFDGVDIDIEDTAHLGQDYSTFVDRVEGTLRPMGKLVTAAVARYLTDDMADTTLHSFDFLNVMVYSSLADSVSELQYYANVKGVPRDKLTLGAGFFGLDADGEPYAYADILAADPDAWKKDATSVYGTWVEYTGMLTMKKLAQYSRGFGGIMFWELSQDTRDDKSLYKVIQQTM